MAHLGVLFEVATLITMWIYPSLAHYSLYILGENLQSYYSNSVYAQLVQDKIVYIVENGEAQVDSSGGLLLSPVLPQSGSGLLGADDLGSGGRIQRSLTQFSSSSVQALPPLPADVDDVEFTWFSTATVMYTLHVMQEGTEFLTPVFDVQSVGTIPDIPSNFYLQVTCWPLAVESGKVHVNLTTVTNHTEMFVSFFLEKSCYDTAVPSFSTVFPQSSVELEDLRSSHILTSPHQVSLSPTPHFLPLPPSSPSFKSTLTTTFSDSPFSVSPSLPSSSLTALKTSSPNKILTTLVSLNSSTVFPPKSAGFPSFYGLPTFMPSFTALLHSPVSPTVRSSFLASKLLSTPTYTSTSMPNFLTSKPSVFDSSSFSPTMIESTSTSLLPTDVPLPLTDSSSRKRMTSIVGRGKESITRNNNAVVSSSVIQTFPDVSERGTNTQLLILICAPLGGILLASIVLLLCIILCIRCKGAGKKAIHVFSDDPLDVVHTVPYSPSAKSDDLKKVSTPLSLWMSLPWGLVTSLPRTLQTLVAELGVDRKSLSIIDTVTRGEYGSVVSGQLNNVRTDVMSGSQSVTIKLLTGFPEGSRRDEVVRFLEAATLMKGIQHHHILPVLRVSVEDNYVPLVIYPMVEHGDMHRAIKLASDPEHTVLPPLTLNLTLKMAIQIATAMKYLTEHSVIHPDLALRNCLLDSGYVVKVSDGALAQQFYPECYYTLFGATRPVRWAAVETLQEGLCTVRSNVWSYAVTVWEILTFAEMPYAEVNNNRSILSTIKMGARLPRPSTCPETLYDLLKLCWNEKGEERPSFKKLLGGLQHILHQISNRDTREKEQSSMHACQRQSSSSTNKFFSSREHLAHGGDSPRSRNHLTHREASHGSLRPTSMASMLSRGSTAEKLSVTFSVLSGNITSGSDSEDENGLELQTFTEKQQEIQSMLRNVSTSFVESPEPPAVVIDDSSMITASDTSSHTLVPPSLVVPLQSPTVCVSADETSLASSNPISLTPLPGQTADTQSKASTVDLESVSTAPYTSSPLHSTAFLYPSPGTGLGVGGNLERGDQSPLTTDHRAFSAHPHASVPSQPSAKSTDSGIRSDEDSEIALSHNASTQNTPQPDGPSTGEKDGVSNFSTSFMAAFDTWDI